MTRNSEIERIVNKLLRSIDDVMFIKMAEDKDSLEELLQVLVTADVYNKEFPKISNHKRRLAKNKS